MATLEELCDARELIRVTLQLERDELQVRSLLALPHVVRWMEEQLPEIEADFSDSVQSPLEQMDDLLHEFLCSEDMSYYERSHSMQPKDPGIWELKTKDLRLFGWFVRRGVFVVGNVDTAFRCKYHGLYAGYRDDVVRRRDALNLDAPKFIVGGYADVF